MDDIRLDKYLWAVRVFKTRSDAAEAIRNNRVMVNDGYCKPSREVKIGDEISVKRSPVHITLHNIPYHEAIHSSMTAIRRMITSCIRLTACSYE